VKKLFAVLLLCATSAVAAPFIVSDPLDPRATNCGVFLDSAAKAVIPVTSVATGNICKFDVGGISNGSHTIKMTAIANDPVWGSLESAESLPLVFARPGQTTIPGGLKLAP
jgi:hypothetical protein